MPDRRDETPIRRDGKRGPATGTGRAAVRHNAVKHGIQSDAPILPEGLEDEKEWSRHLAGMYESWEPETHQERILVDRLATVYWRLKRLERYEIDVAMASAWTTGEDLARGIRWRARNPYVKPEEPKSLLSKKSSGLGGRGWYPAAAL